jgi:hypothetical protein
MPNFEPLLRPEDGEDEDVADFEAVNDGAVGNEELELEQVEVKTGR